MMEGPQLVEEFTIAGEMLGPQKHGAYVLMVDEHGPAGEAEKQLVLDSTLKQSQGMNVRVLRKGDPGWEQPTQHEHFGRPELWSQSNPCDSELPGRGADGGGTQEVLAFQNP